MIGSKLVSLYFPYEEQDTFHLQPMCYEGVLRFCMSLRETFFKSIYLEVIKVYDKIDVMQI